MCKPRRNILRIGSLVLHKRHGIGKVGGEWGQWWACRNCSVEVADKFSKCPDCVDPGKPVKISGTDVYEVQFGRELRSVNRCWLTPVRTR